MAKAEQPEPCPACTSTNVVEWVYGEPTPAAAAAGERGELMIGGCLVWPDRPVWHCKACGNDWGRIGDEPGFPKEEE